METTAAIENDRDNFLACEAVLLARTYAWELLHKLFGGELTDELLTLVGSATTFDALDELARANGTFANVRDFATKVGQRSGDPDFLEAAREEFSLFFQGPAEPPAYPWEGPYLTHETTVFQPSTLEVRRAYTEAGLRVKRYQRVPDDHVAIMAAFMAEMGRRTLAALDSADGESARSLLAMQYAFSRDHMAPWLPEYAELSLRVKKAVLYPQFIQGARALAEADGTFLPEALAWLGDMDDERLADAAERGLFAEMEAALDSLAGVSLPGLEDNELVAL